MGSKEDLDTHQKKLLSEINQLEEQTNTNENESKRLQELQFEYNQTLDKTESLCTPVLPDPCKVLPFELWEAIVQDSLYVDPGSEPGRNPDNWIVDKLLVLTNVSTVWERFIITTPSFWTNITLLSETEDAAIKAALCLYLSGDLLLDIRIKVPTAQPVWSLLGPMIGAESSRIRSITFFGEFIDNEKRHPFARVGINTMLDSFRDLSSLESFTSSVKGDNNVDLDLVLVQAQNIRSMNGVQLPDDSIDCASLKTIQSIETPEPITDALPLLQRYTSLKHVVFTSAGAASATTCQLKEDANPFDLPLGWSHLRVEQGIVESIDCLVKRVAYSLVELKLSIGWDMLPQMIVSCSSGAKKLESLSLTFPCPYAYNFTALPEAPPIPTLHTLSLMLGDHALSQKANPLVTTQTLRGSDDCFFDTLTAWAPFVKKLRVWTCTSRASCVIYAESLPNLENLFLRSWVGEISDPPRDVKFLVLKELTFIGYDLLFSRLVCPLLSKVKTDLSDNSSNVFKINEALLPNPDPWKSLRSIELDEFKSVWWGIPLPNLEVVIVDYPLHLLQMLALHPKQYPALNHIKMRSFPDWDILFILLERRNFQQDEGISMIKTLSIPSLPSPAILVPLIHRLRGYYSPRPSNFELSIDTIGPLSLDIDIPGCKDCHRVFTFCSQSPRELHDPPFDSDIKPPEPPTLPPYPTAIDKILEGCVTRNELWHSAIKASGRNRLKLCNLRASGSGLVEITGYTDTGVWEG